MYIQLQEFCKWPGNAFLGTTFSQKHHLGSSQPRTNVEMHFIHFENLSVLVLNQPSILHQSRIFLLVLALSSIDCC